MEGTPAKLIVRNTFIEASSAAEEDEPPERTVSDQTGLHSKTVIQLGRVGGRPQPIPEQSVAAPEDEEDVGHVLGADLMGALGVMKGDPDEEEDEDDDMPLTRTQSYAYPAYAGHTAMSAQAPDPKDLAAALQRCAEGGGEDMSGAFPDWAMQGVHGMPWGYMPYGMYGGGWGMYPHYPGQMGAEDGKDGEGHEDPSSSSSWSYPATVPALGSGPALGCLHAFHSETQGMGIVSPDFRQFSKVGYEGRLSVVTEKDVHSDGIQRYLVQFTSGELSKADGVGFVFSPKLPCAKNIQRIVSIFVNQSGRICMRVFADIIRASAYVKPLELGDWVEMAIDLEARIATFNIWPSTATGWPELVGRPASTAVFPYGQRLGKLDPESGEPPGKSPKAGHKPIKLNVGHLACVVKNIGVMITLLS